jgi:hypothetical protein
MRKYLKELDEEIKRLKTINKEEEKEKEFKSKRELINYLETEIKLNNEDKINKIMKILFQTTEKLNPVDEMIADLMADGEIEEAICEYGNWNPNRMWSIVGPIIKQRVEELLEKENENRDNNNISDSGCLIGIQVQRS